MASTIILSDNGASSGSAGLKSTAGNDGVLILQTTTSGGTATNAVYVDNNQNVGLGTTPSAWASVMKAIQLGSGGSIFNWTGSSGVVSLGANLYDAGSSVNRYINSAASSKFDVGNGTFTWSTSASGTAGNVITFTQSLGLGKGTTLALEGATSQSGTGITFPATQSASTDANTLDDYEEGTWTPTITFDSGPSSITYQTQTARYTKIGNTVNVWFYIQINTVSGAGGSAYVSGLPFTCNGTIQGGVTLNWANIGFSSTVAFAGHIPVNQARAYLVYMTGGATAQLPAGQVISNTQIIMAGSYQV